MFIGGLTLFILWSALAMLWSESPSDTPLEVERLLVYAGAAVVVKAMVRRRHVPFLVAGLWAAMAGVCAYALATRLFPEHFKAQSYGGLRLSTPIGYWNGLGLVAVMAALLAVALAARVPSRAVRALAAGSVPALLLTLYLTFSRGAWLALGLGLVVLFAVDRRRVHLLAVAVPPAVVTALLIWRASRQDALTRSGATAAAASHAGHHLAVVVAAAVVACAIASLGLAELERRLQVPRLVSRAAGSLAIAVVLAATAGVFVHYGSPVTLAHRAYRSISSSPPATHGNLNNRLFSLSSNGRLAQWRVAIHAFERHPLLGTGPGSYQQEWYAHRPGNWTVQDAHSLYLETLGETGIVGLVLLATALAAPLALLGRARREPLAAGAVAAYIAYLAHAAVDWDWELSGVTLAALLCAGALLAAGRSDSRAGRWRSLPIMLGTVVTVAAFAGLAGNLAMSASKQDAIAGNYAKAASEARRARFLAPWSATPWQLLGDAQSGLGQQTAAVQSLQTAVSKESGDWQLWLDLAEKSYDTSVTRDAITAAERLDPLDPQIPAFAKTVGLK